MGRLLTNLEREDRVVQAETLVRNGVKSCLSSSLPEMKSILKPTLDLYFSLCAISRGKGSADDLRFRAEAILFPLRVRIERVILENVLLTLRTGANVRTAKKGCLFGFSKKQGTSVRFPLASCQPTSKCASACYAHDVLDAAPNSVIRGAINGGLGKWFSEISKFQQENVIGELESDCRNAIREALRELSVLPKGYKRPAFIRFAHVGDAAAYYEFANALAAKIKKMSRGRVQSVVYTRHSDAKFFDPEVFVVNFTLDSSSMDRANWIPPFARRVFSAFGGIVDRDSEVNFLEHHRWHHSKPIGLGMVCPATKPEAPEHTCDAVRCHKCFVAPTQKVESPNGH